MLVAQLQLALKHPENQGEPARFAREFIQHMGAAMAETTQIEEVLQVIAAGNHPEWDMTDKEADKYFGTEQSQDIKIGEWLGSGGDMRLLDAVACHVLASRWLASYISATEGVSGDSILRQAREKAWRRYQTASPEELQQTMDAELKAWAETARADDLD